MLVKYMDPNWVLINYLLEVTLHPGARGFCVRARGVEPEDIVCGVRAREYGNLVIFGFGTLDSYFELRLRTQACQLFLYNRKH